MGMYCGNTSIVVVESRGKDMNCEAYKSKLAAVLAMMDFGDLGGGMSYGCDQHKDALNQVEQKLAKVRASIEEVEKDDAATAE